MRSRGLFIVLDGWGYSTKVEHNAIRQAGTPTLDRLVKEYPWTLLHASGRAVGLPPDTPGNSEVGHLTLGAGRTIDYESTRVQMAMEAGELQRHPLLTKALHETKERDGRVHIMGLASDGNIHSHLDHFRPIVEAASRMGLTGIYLHLFTDGRDAPSGAAIRFIADIQDMLLSVGAGQVASVVGRNYAMDKNGNWQKTQAAFEMMTLGVGKPVRTAEEAIKTAYQEAVADDLIPPFALVDGSGQPVGVVKDGDLLFSVNFRGDRMHQILRAFVDEPFSEFPRFYHSPVTVLTMTDYHMSPALPSLFEHLEVRDTLGDVLDQYGNRNLRVSETEKYPHVTFFFNGREHRDHQFEQSIHVPGPKNSDYRRTPEMSAAGIVREVKNALARQEQDLIVANLVNADTVGHTGDMEAAKRAVRTVDSCMGEIIKAANEYGYWTALCGDHGNAEVMFNEAMGVPHVGHTTNPVPFVLVHPSQNRALRLGASFADVAPTLLKLLDIPKPTAMTGESLV
ncbi:MAG TPA: 2,3-bisphosphoglycerate-independent phosphoglycerate mutase [Blastocatellia bacterium]|nr:2,3-bisphosphoglycerate-independent phosphoglycerate mutase [Blastocatellia bacterium]